MDSELINNVSIQWMLLIVIIIAVFVIIIIFVKVVIDNFIKEKLKVYTGKNQIKSGVIIAKKYKN